LILQFQLVGVLIKLENLENLSDDIEVTISARSGLEGGQVFLLDNGVLSKEGVGPLLEGLDNSQVLRLLSGFLARVSIRSISDNMTERGSLLRGVENPGANVVHVDVELSLVVVDSQFCSVDSNDVTDSVDDGEVLESIGVDDNSGVVLSGSLRVESGINDLQRADEEFISLVGEGSVNDNTIEVASVGGSKGGLGELDILVLGGGSGFGSRLKCSGWGS
jgi:hypothetical protein